MCGNRTKPGSACTRTHSGGFLPIHAPWTLRTSAVSAARAAETAEVRKVRGAWIGKKPPEWVRVHALPGFVRFPHMRHIKVLGRESCSTCHGDVRAMPQVYQVSTLRMGWCVTCHAQRQVSRDCTLCHY